MTEFFIRPIHCEKCHCVGDGEYFISPWIWKDDEYECRNCGKCIPEDMKIIIDSRDSNMDV